MSTSNVKCYIAGRITGINYEYAKSLFLKAEKILSKRGYKPVNPTKLCKSNWNWYRCMVVCIWNLIWCKYVYMLPNWSKSKGAKIEYKISVLLNKIIILE